jgi:hypothetical protein
MASNSYSCEVKLQLVEDIRYCTCLPSAPMPRSAAIRHILPCPDEPVYDNNMLNNIQQFKQQQISKNDTAVAKHVSVVHNLIMIQFKQHSTRYCSAI